MKKILLTLGAMTLTGSSAFAATLVDADIITDTKWTTAGSPYILNKLIVVKDGATLDIAPGVIVRGQPYAGSPTLFPAGSLLIGKTGKIQARGNSGSPIIFTTAAVDVDGNGVADRSDQGFGDAPTRWTPANGDNQFFDADPAGNPLAPRDANGLKNDSLWGGVIFVGDALANVSQDVDGDTIADDYQGIVEGLSGPEAVYGGFNDMHDQGTMEYVSIRHGGIGIDPNEEINALTLYAVGRETSLSYIDIYCTSDDGIELFGGSVSLDHVNLSYVDDDSVDTDQGYRGTIQYGLVFQGAGFGDHGFELDGDDSASGEAVSPLDPITDARILNFTVITHSSGGDDAVNLDSGFSGLIANSVFVEASGDATAGNGFAFSFDPAEALSSEQQFRDGELKILSNTVFGYAGGNFDTIAAGAGKLGAAVSFTSAGAYSGATLDPVFVTGTTSILTRNAVGDPDFLMGETTVNKLNPRFGVGPGSAPAGNLTALTVASPLVDEPADAVTYRGAFAPGAATLWTFGWTALNKRGVLAD